MSTKSKRRVALWTIVTTVVAAVLQTTLPGGIIPASIVQEIVSSQMTTPFDN